MVVEKNALMLRDGQGNLLPMEIPSDLFKGNVKILPMVDGDLNKIKAEKEVVKDEDIIEKYLVEPKLSREEIDVLPKISKLELVKLILMTTGLSRDEVEVTLKKGIEMMMDRIKKK
jgi:hypothetical protein